jgi:D-alanyl-D-alanine carboxypeptidase/D-alanyl-D-alanine-endopeptidase (penicillin-binding protein 4)
VGKARLSAGLAAALADPALGAARDHVCLLVSQGGAGLFGAGTGQRLIPASNLKLLTATAALSRLGPQTRFTTEVRADRPQAGGVVDGNLYLVGGGDPLLQTADYNASLKEHRLPDDGYTHLEALARAVFDAGVRRVTGGVVGDEGRYDTQRYVPTWKPEYATASEVGPVSALSVNDGFVQFGPPKVVAAPAPAVLASGALQALLVKLGVQVAGAPGQGRAPAGAAPIASLQSPPVAIAVSEMLRESDNNTAEVLTKELGARFGGAGTTAAGVAVIREALAKAGLPVGDLSAVDGSGLDRSDRASCPLLLAALTSAGLRSPLADGLAVAARSGTLLKRFAGTPAADRLRAKTGSLEHVVALTGWVTGPDPPLAFALVANEVPRDQIGVALEDRVGTLLAAFPDAPPITELGPLAPVGTAGAAGTGAATGPAAPAAP